LAGGARRDEESARSSGATSAVGVFVSDPTAEAEGVADALRARGCVVVDVPQSMLVARVAVQRPRVILLDADGPGALDVAARIRDIPSADEVHVLFLGRPGGAISSPEAAVAHAGSGLFVRPVEVDAVVAKVEALLGAPPSVGSAPAGGPQSSGPRSVPVVTLGPSLPPASMRAPDATLGSGPLRKLAGIAPPVSSELQQLLAEAEQRVSVPPPSEATAPTPAEEIEAVLPAELLASLDEALDEDEDDDEPAPAPRHAVASGGGGRERTDGGGTRTTGAGASTTGSGATPAATATRASPKENLTPAVHDAAPHTQAGSPGSTSSAAEATPARDAVEDDAVHAFPPVLDAGDAERSIARAIALRTTACLCFASEGIERRVVFRDGDIVTAASTGPDETLLAFLGARGDLPRETVRRLASKFPPFGRHGGAALVAKGYLRQDQMWPTLRAHAEWVVTRALQTGRGVLALEAEAPGRLGAEPNVFGGSSGAEVFVDLIRRTVPLDEAVSRLGGVGCRLLAGPTASLLDETALAAGDLAAMREAAGRTLRDVLDRAPEGDLATVVLALADLGVFEVVEAPAAGDQADRGSSPDIEALDTEAVKERVRARVQVVDDGDYFAVLGVSRDATGYEIRRAYLELRRSFDPSRIFTPETASLAADVRKITAVLDEAYEILKDAARRERYRRAIEASPDLAG
jgi:hypothetical protein